MIESTNTKRALSIIQLSGAQGIKQRYRELLFSESLRHGNLPRPVNTKLLTNHRNIDRKLKLRQSLSFEEAYALMCLTLSATNQYIRKQVVPSLASESYNLGAEQLLAIAAGFLQLMAGKETYVGLTSEEIAGMVAAVTHDFAFVINAPAVIETSGMGGDRGFSTDLCKTINISTLSAIVLAAMGHKVVKHGSYSNTSQVGSTDAIEKLGANTSFPQVASAYNLLEKTNFCFIDAHLSKTVHDLSHLLLVETINHVIGPMTAPLSSKTSLTKILGANEKIHPSAISNAYRILCERQLISGGTVAVIAGLNQVNNPDPDSYQVTREHTILDELSPYTSIVSFSYKRWTRGSFVIRPSDFGAVFDPDEVRVANNQASIMTANIKAIRGGNIHLSNYLAMNAALVLFTKQYGGIDNAFAKSGPRKDLLQECYRECCKTIKSGAASRQLESFVNLSNKV